MATSLRLNGNRDLAAQYWGEAKRVLFQLNQVLEAGGIDTGARNLAYPDGTIISVRSSFGNAIIEITSPFPVIREEKKKGFTFYILCYRSSSLRRIYLASIEKEGNGVSFSISETDEDPSLLDIIFTGTASAVCILENEIFEDEENAKYAIHHGLSFGDWLKNAYSGTFIATQNIEYADRYIYIDPGYPGGAIYQVPHRLIDRFGGTNRASFFASRFYYPKLTDPENNIVEWTLGLHADHGVSADIKGKNNVTLNSEKTHAVSWGERIHEQGNAPYSFSLTSGGTTVTNPFPGSPAGWHISYHGKYTWPIIGTLNARKQPTIYSLQYEDDSGTHTISDFLTETLSFTYLSEGTTGNFSENYSGSSVNFWIIAAIGDRKAAYLKNSLSESGTGGSTQVKTGETPYGDLYTTTYSYSHQENLVQEFYAGDEIVETLQTVISQSRSGSDIITMPVEPTFIEERDDQMSFEGTFRWVEVLDYCNHEGNFLCVYKKITETISNSFVSHFEGQYLDPNMPGSKSKTIQSNRAVEYWLYWKIGEASGKNLLATFNGGHSAESDYLNGVSTHSSSHFGSGERVYGASVQLTGLFGAVSFNKETFKGIGSEDYYKCPLGFNGTVNRWIGTEMGVVEHIYKDPMPYPFPLEDMNSFLGTGEYAWDGKFCVGAINVSAEDMEPGYFDYGEFPNQTDIVSATGVIVLPQGG